MVYFRGIISKGAACKIFCRKTAGSVEEPVVWCYNLTVMNKQNTEVYYTPIQLKFPLGFEKIIKIDDPVYTFSEVMAHIDLQKYFVKKGNEMGRPDMTVRNC
jgi:hypothetical protein